MSPTGNLDLIGPEILLSLENSAIPVLHHIGYVTPPFGAESIKYDNYRLVAASKAVQKALVEEIKQIIYSIPVVYPGARYDLFNKHKERSLPAPLGPDLTGQHRLGSSTCPLRICFAGVIRHKVLTQLQKPCCWQSTRIQSRSQHCRG